MRLKTYIETQELTEGTFLFEQQVYRELQECTYEDWCNILITLYLPKIKNRLGLIKEKSITTIYKGQSKV